MKRINYLLFAVCLFSFSSCMVQSIHPFYQPEDVIFNEDLLGEYSDDEGQEWAFQPRKIHSKEDSTLSITASYYLKGTTDDEKVCLYATLFELGENTYVDFTIDDESLEVATSGQESSFLTLHMLPLHTVGRVVTSKDSITIDMLDSEWLETLFETKRIRLSHIELPDYDWKSNKEQPKKRLLLKNKDEKYEIQEVEVLYPKAKKKTGKNIVLTATTNELQKFLLKFGSSPEAYGDSSTLILKKKK